MRLLTPQLQEARIMATLDTHITTPPEQKKWCVRRGWIGWYEYRRAFLSSMLGQPVKTLEYPPLINGQEKTFQTQQFLLFSRSVMQ